MQGLRLGAGQSGVYGGQLEPGQQGGGGQGGGLPRRIHYQRAAILPGVVGVFDFGVDPVDGVIVGVLAQSASGDGGPVCCPQGVTPTAAASNNVN
jgi:hypothetical protein